MVSVVVEGRRMVLAGHVVPLQLHGWLLKLGSACLGASAETRNLDFLHNLTVDPISPPSSCQPRCVARI